MPKYWTRDEVIAELKRVQGSRTQTEFAEMVGVSQSFLARVCAGERNPNDSILDFLELEDAGQLYQKKVRK